MLSSIQIIITTTFGYLFHYPKVVDFTVHHVKTSWASERNILFFPRRFYREVSEYCSNAHLNFHYDWLCRTGPWRTGAKHSGQSSTHHNRKCWSVATNVMAVPRHVRSSHCMACPIIQTPDSKEMMTWTMVAPLKHRHILSAIANRDHVPERCLLASNVTSCSFRFHSAIATGAR